MKFIKQKLNYFLKNNSLVFNFLTYLLYLYLKFAYLTSKIEFKIPKNFDKNILEGKEGLLIAMWHSKLAYGLAYGLYCSKLPSKNIYALVSPHSDGKILSRIVNLMKFNSIEGSTNENAYLAIKEIIKQLKNGNEIVVTPDGPRGPVYKNNSAITKIASKYNKKIVPLTCVTSRCFKLNSWDQLMIPKPFSKIKIIIGNPLNLSGDEQSDKFLLEEKLNELSN